MRSGADTGGFQCKRHQIRRPIWAQASIDISQSLRLLLADVFTLYVKTKNFHWHISGPQFGDYHLLLDEHAEQLLCPSGATRTLTQNARRGP